MKTDNEYPATHSMSTAWFCVDEDGNVGIFDIEDDGPVPVGGYTQDGVDDILWTRFLTEGDGFKRLPLSSEQILSMLNPVNSVGEWKVGYCGLYNDDWHDVLIFIDMEKIHVLKEASSFLKKNCMQPICLSEEDGVFYVDFSQNKKGVELLEQNHVVISKYKAPQYRVPWDDESEQRFMVENRKYPLFIYHQDYCPNYEPAIRWTNPEHPLKVGQLPPEVQKKVKILPLRFRDMERIQLAEFLPVEYISTIEYVYDNMLWYELASSDNTLLYYNAKKNIIIKKEDMDRLIANGEAEEYEYEKHKGIKNQQ